MPLKEIICNKIKRSIKRYFHRKQTVITIKYYDYNYKICNGEIQVNERISNNVEEFFESLFIEKFPINKIELSKNRPDLVLIDNNITTGFNFRKVKNKKILSKHALGLAFDVNPKDNPAKPSLYKKFYNENSKKGKLTEKNKLKNIIEIHTIVNDFEWGGEIFGSFWDSHHFESKMNIKEWFLKRIYENL